ncbi:MAG: histidine kinase, partial [Spirochaetaceae bacterium]|nr:histidine kinase [Spirochaetaceae bacterium]
MAGRVYARFSVCASIILFITAFFSFSVKYVFERAEIPCYFDVYTAENAFIFYISFYIPYLLTAAAWAGCFFLPSWIGRGLCFTAACAMTVIQGYTQDDFWKVTVCLYCAQALLCAACFPFIKALLLAFLQLFLFWAMTAEYALLGMPVYGGVFIPVPAAERCAASLFIVLCAAAALFEKNLGRNAELARSTIRHLSESGGKLIEFNTRLQEYAKEAREKAVRDDRLRFTSDLHDSSGYVFTNIIALSEAAMSWPEFQKERVQETFQIIHREARAGLQKTRYILRSIRALPDTDLTLASSIFSMKAIFEEVMRIKVDVDYGNSKNDYGAKINSCTTRIIQESFTNS